MRSFFLHACMAILIVCTFVPATFADTTTFTKAVVLDIAEQSASGVGETAASTRRVTVQFQNADPRRQTATINDGDFGTNAVRRYAVGDMVVIARQQTDDGTVSYAIADRYRLPTLVFFIAGFLLFAGLVGRRYGVGSLAGLAVGIGVIAGGMIPLILAGYSPLLVAAGGAAVIALATFYPTHGFTRETTLALVATLVVTAGAFGFAMFFAWLAGLAGYGSEEASLLAASGPVGLDLSGIFLAGIVIGTLGALNDTTIAQVATVAELAASNPTLTRRDLFARAMRVGRQHIASMVNTLVLAYAGTALPLLLLVSLNPVPLWVTLNNAAIAEEIVRTVVGSVAIVAAIPLATVLAVWDVEKLRTAALGHHGHTHSFTARS